MNKPDKKRLAIIGCGSSGLVTLKYALDELPDWDIVCFEKSGSVTGCWGRPPAGFVSTSTKYATQFACFKKFHANLERNDDNEYADFFRDGQYGDYLEEFAAALDLRSHVRLNSVVDSVKRVSEEQWELSVRRLTRSTSEPSTTDTDTETFSAIVVCTGLADQPKPIANCSVPVLESIEAIEQTRNKSVVVVGGGESAVDVADRLANPELGNKVYLSLRSGVRVSPRYHPIRGVPSDFLRNRLLLSLHHNVRNAIGQKFVEFRILFSKVLKRLFPEAQENSQQPDAASNILARRKEWDLKLTMTAKDRLFNVYHNKSDDFLDAVAQQRIKIIGAPVDDQFYEFYHFQSNDRLKLDIDLVVPAIGYRSTIEHLFDDQVKLDEFFQGCIHVQEPSLFAVGFTRPIIGNIPSISEMQARWVCGIIAEKHARPEKLEQTHASNRRALEAQFPQLDTDAVYPVEMFPYCDQLANMMDCYPSIKRAGGFLPWWRFQRAPATTMHYFKSHLEKLGSRETPVHSPLLITALLLLIKPVDFLYRLLRG